VVGMLKREFPRLAIVGSGYSYLQEWLPSVGQAAVREGLTDFVGLGRMVLSYPELPAHVLEGKSMTRQLICRTFSDCTSGPRNGLVSGCFPLDPFYKSHPDAEKLKALKERQATR
jgi:NADPH2 dehydrogenase